MTPMKVTLEIIRGVIQLRVDAPETEHGYTVLESLKFRNGKSIPSLRRHGQQYAKRYGISFHDDI